MLDNVKCEYVRNNWFKGVCSGYSFIAKVYDEPSDYGIEEGKVSKLCITDSEGNWVVSYDRGWDVEPDDSVVGCYTDIVDYLEDLDVKAYF